MILFGVWSVKKRLSLVTLPLAVIMIRGFQKLLMGWALFLYHVMMVYGMVVPYQKISGDNTIDNLFSLSSHQLGIGESRKFSILRMQRRGVRIAIIDALGTQRTRQTGFNPYTVRDDDHGVFRPLTKPREKGSHTPG